MTANNPTADWQPIETAPKDGSKVLFWSPDSEEKYWVGEWNGKWWDNGDYAIPDPTHWMPLPPPP